MTQRNHYSPFFNRAETSEAGTSEVSSAQDKVRPHFKNAKQFWKLHMYQERGLCINGVGTLTINSLQLFVTAYSQSVY